RRIGRDSIATRSKRNIADGVPRRSGDSMPSTGNVTPPAPVPRRPWRLFESARDGALHPLNEALVHADQPLARVLADLPVVIRARRALKLVRVGRLATTATATVAGHGTRRG